ncbi:hypothetical protein SAMN05720469_11636 [Fibrobacter intestinalis]|uniref:Uncharacterized protein n=1 Tax=Fibrobacter intestinalis TaxID=28122 RepID=A0A1M6V1N4_9BACT|nr:hypothetical protein BGX14_2241 [Fibrobacter sp. UWS1]SHK75206.1 hypothetical protein SAMN05720469_11636 [Fibrobacter intestinalis]
MKNFTRIAIFIFVQMYVFAKCPVSSDESRLRYDYGPSVWLICDYQNGRLISRFLHQFYEVTTVDYYSNGLPKEYNLRSINGRGSCILKIKNIILGEC